MKAKAVRPAAKPDPMTWKDWLAVAAVLIGMPAICITGGYQAGFHNGLAARTDVRVVQAGFGDPECVVLEHKDHPQITCRWPESAKGAAPALTFPMPEAQLN